MSGNYTRVVPQTFTDAVDLPASATPVTVAVDAIRCITGGTVVVVTAAASAAASVGQTPANGATHTFAMTAGQEIDLACAKITGDGTFVGLGLIL